MTNKTYTGRYEKDRGKCVRREGKHRKSKSEIHVGGNREADRIATRREARN